MHAEQFKCTKHTHTYDTHIRRIDCVCAGKKSPPHAQLFNLLLFPFGFCVFLHLAEAKTKRLLLLLSLPTDISIILCIRALSLPFSQRALHFTYTSITVFRSFIAPRHNPMQSNNYFGTQTFRDGENYVR